MAQIHAYKHSGKDVILFGIDHSVGRHGTNRMDDVQLIQLLINRYIDYREDWRRNKKAQRTTMRASWTNPGERSANLVLMASAARSPWPPSSLPKDHSTSGVG